MHQVKLPQGHITLTAYQNAVYSAFLGLDRPASWRFIAERINWHSPSSIRTAVSQLTRFGLVRQIDNRGGEHRWLYAAVKG